MSREANDFIEPWTYNKFSSSSQGKIHGTTNQVINMTKSSMPYAECYPSQNAQYSCKNKAEYIATQRPKKNPARVDPCIGSNGVFRNGSTRYNKHDHCLESRKSEFTNANFYYDVGGNGSETFNFQSKVAELHDHTDSTDHSQYRCNTFLDNYDVPGSIESESSSLNNSMDLAEAPQETYYSKSACAYDCVDRYRTENEYNSTNNDHHIPNQYNLKPAAYKERNKGTQQSYGKERDDRKKAPCDEKCKMIEIAPGQHMRLRGAQETWKAIRNDFYLPCSCVCCDLTLFCIQDASYVLCPQCQVVNPMEKIDGYDGGVGLGFTMEELAAWQNDIVSRF
jgi:hypothetical protein